MTAFFPPAITLWTFLSQVLSEDGSCRQAVSRVIVFFKHHGWDPPSSETGAYCRARHRLSEGLLARLVHQTGADLEAQRPASSLWHGFRLLAADGTGISMPDTPENQAEYPQPSSQAPGCGFPVMRLVVIFSLVTGALLQYAWGSLHASEMVLFRALLTQLTSGDLLIADRYYGVFAVMAGLHQRGAQGVCRVAASRITDFRRGKHLGKDDHLIAWQRPTIRPRNLSDEEYAQLPAQLLLREVRGKIDVPGWRTRTVILVTTLLDPIRYPRQQLLDLYALRWQCELRLRDLKVSLHMDVLRTRSPEMVRKELLAHLLAYNLIRSLLWVAAENHHLDPMRLSFKGAAQHVRTFAPILAATSARAVRAALFSHLLDLLAREVVPIRPERAEPRLKKRRPKSYGWLQKPRYLCQRLIKLGRRLK
ncbi:MAG: IS4 family transposase [Chloroflexota bacterium]